MAEAVESRKHTFRLAYAALALAFWLSIAGFVLLLMRPNHSAASEWSTWRPAADGLAGAHEISSKVAARYKGENGAQLMAVQEHGAQVQGLRLEAVGVRRLNQEGQINPFIALYHGERTLIYAFCGLQSNCALDGESTPQREQLLRRAALELALYSFKYLKDVDQVVSLIDNVKVGGTSAVFLRKNQLKPELAHPLRATLPLQEAPPAGTPDTKEGPVIDALTLANTFPAHFEPLPDGDAILVLDVQNQATG